MAMNEVRLTGFLESENRLVLEHAEHNDFNFNKTTFGVKLEAWPSEQVHFFCTANVQVTSADGDLDNGLDVDVGDERDLLFADLNRLALNETYLKFLNLGQGNLDIRVGKQRIQWGTADQFNPTDNLNPDDVHNPLKFGTKTPTLALQANYYLGPFTFNAVFLPLFYTARLPANDLYPVYEVQFREMTSDINIDTGYPALDGLIGMFLGGPQTPTLGTFEIESQLPPNTFDNVNVGLKAAATFGALDMSLSYAYARDDFGVPGRVTIMADPVVIGPGPIVDDVDVQVDQEFPRLHVLGADFAASIPKLDIGFWGEAGYYIPRERKTRYFVDLSKESSRLLSGGESGLAILVEEPLDDNYFKVSAGFDYTFSGALYTNFQYVRGMPADNTKELIADYLTSVVEKPFFHDEFKFRLFLGNCVDDASLIFFPQVFWYPKTWLEFRTGLVVASGDLDTKFGQFGDDISFVDVKITF
jgi:hypothetical protein